MKDILYNVYVSYLANVAKSEQRGFKPPKSLKSLDERNDKSFFYVLEKLLLKNNINEKEDVIVFMEVAFNHLTMFNIIDIVKEYDAIINKYTIFKKDNTDEEKIKKIKKTVAFLEEYSIINNINKWETFTVGNPPLILKLWKEEKIYEIVLIHIFDFDLVKKKTWYKIYCKKINDKIKMLKKEINHNILLFSILESEIEKLKKILK